MATMTSAEPPSPDEVAADRAHDGMTAAIQEALDAVQGIADPTARFRAAKRHVSTLRTAVETGAGAHAQAAASIHKAEALSLAGLAERIGVSKARAQQLVDAAKKETPQP